MSAHRLAAPSWVFPAGILENCRFLEGRVDEAALLFFETEACLAYGRQDLPPELAALSLSWHVHLPSDLPWHGGGAEAAAVCAALMDKVAFLGASRAVLHPPPGGEAEDARLLADFARAWGKAGRHCRDVLLENTRDNDLTGLGGCVADNSFGICLDLGHMLAYEQTDLAAMVMGRRRPIWPAHALPRMVHLNAPGPGPEGAAPASAHLPLDTLDEPGAALGARLCAVAAPDAVLVAEFFEWGYIERSVPIIDRWRKGM